MSKRAEEKAIAYQLATRGPNVMGGASILSEDEYRLLNTNHDFKAGYEQAEKETIKRAVAWLEENANKYIVNMTDSYPDAPFKATVGGKCWNDLRKAMEEE